MVGFCVSVITKKKYFGVILEQKGEDRVEARFSPLASADEVHQCLIKQPAAECMRQVLNEDHGDETHRVWATLSGILG